MNSDKGKRLTRLMSHQDPSNQGPGEPKLDRNTQTRIGDQLRAMYDELVHQPVPDRFRELLDQLEQGRVPGQAR